MAQGATERPVKPNWMAAMVSWNRLVLVEKKVGALMDTAFVMAWDRKPLMSPCPSFWRETACTGAHRHVSSSQRPHAIWGNVWCLMGQWQALCGSEEVEQLKYCLWPRSRPGLDISWTGTQHKASCKHWHASTAAQLQDRSSTEQGWSRGARQTHCLAHLVLDRGLEGLERLHAL